MSFNLYIYCYLHTCSEAFKPIIEDKVITDIASSLSADHSIPVEPAHVLLRWGIQRNISVLPKSSTPSRIKSNFDITGKFGLSNDQMHAISRLNHGLRYADMDVLTGQMGISLNPSFYEGDILPKEKQQETKQ